VKTKSLLVPALGLFGLLTLAGCDADFDPGSNVSSLRVLTVQADNPYASPGETVHLSATYYDPDARDITWAWLQCSNPASSSVDGCLAEIAETAIASGELPLIANGVGVDNVDVSIPVDALDALPLEGRPNALTGVLSIACPGTLDVDLGAGTEQGSILPFRCTDAAGVELDLHDTIVGVKRIFVRQTDRNQNPSILDVTFDGEPWAEDDVKEVDFCETDDFSFDDCKGKGDHRIAAQVTPESFETGTDEFGRAFAEELVVQHYATDGIFEYEVRIAELPETRFVARSVASGQELRLWFVARDDRGGVTLAERRVRVR
jgi:hypothetical protein